MTDSQSKGRINIYIDYLVRTWISRYNKQMHALILLGDNIGVLFIYQRMVGQGVIGDAFSIPPILKAAGLLGRKAEGNQLHARAVVFGYLSGNAHIYSGLTSFYTEIMDLTSSRRVLEELFQQQLLVSELIFPTAIKASVLLGEIHTAAQLHARAVKLGYIAFIALSNSLLVVYGRIGDQKSLMMAFNEINHPDIVSYNSMIYELSLNDPIMALLYFAKLIATSLQPNQHTMSAVLTAYHRALLYNEGSRFYEEMSTTYGIESNEILFSCYVNLTAASGNIPRALELISTMPQPPPDNLMVYTLSCCYESGYSWTDTQEIMDGILEKPDSISADMYSAMISQARKYRKFLLANEIYERMRKAQLQKVPGLAWVHNDTLLD